MSHAMSTRATTLLRAARRCLADSIIYRHDTNSIANCHSHQHVALSEIFRAATRKYNGMRPHRALKDDGARLK
jgi:hypothetical protein